MTMARMTMVVALGAVMATAASAAGAGADFERVTPEGYGDMLLAASKAYDGKRYEEAFQAFQRTACAGDKQSQSAIGRMYLLGQGVTRNDITGYAWLKAAAEVRFPGYQTITHQLEEAMTPEQRRIADPKAEKLIGLYGLRATNMSCRTAASRHGHIIDSIVCTPERDGPTLLVKQCVAEAPVAGG